MLFTASQPRPPRTALRPAGSRLPRKPNGLRLSAIWASPVRGPHEANTPWNTAPRALPSTSGDGLPEAQPEDEHGEDPDEHGGELHVRRRPDPGLLIGAPVALRDRDRLGAARLDGRDPGAVLALQGLE